MGAYKGVHGDVYEYKMGKKRETTVEVLGFGVEH